MEYNKQNDTLSQENNKGSKNSKNKLFAIIAGVFVAIVVVVLYINHNNNTSYHTYGNVSFSAPGEWVIMNEKTETVLDFIAATTKVVSNGSYDVTIITMNSPEQITPEIASSVLDSFMQDTPDVKDVCKGSADTFSYAGGWVELKEANKTDIDASFMVINTEYNTYTGITVSGNMDEKNNIIDTFKSIKYKDVVLFNK